MIVVSDQEDFADDGVAVAEVDFDGGVVKDHLAGLTPAQLQAVKHRDGPITVIAGAGSGKTSVITRRIADLLLSGVSGHRILAITFTNKAAGEMRRRVEEYVPGHRATLSTFHSFGGKLLRDHHKELNIDRDYGIADEDDRTKIVREAIHRLGLDPKKYGADKVGEEISALKGLMVAPREAWQKADSPWLMGVAQVYAAYEHALRRQNRVDFDDLIMLPVMVLRQNEELRRKLDERYRYVLVDEYQDTNTCQYEMMRLLTRSVSNLMVVGDSDQAIYGWRGADIRNILDFQRDYPDAVAVKLEQNFRSTPQVLTAANRVILHNTQRIKKTLVTDNRDGDPVQVYAFRAWQKEAHAVVEDIRQAVESGMRGYGDHAILVRVSHLMGGMEEFLSKAKIPYRLVGGMSFFDRKEVKDVLAYCRAAVNPADAASFLRVVNEPDRGVGKVGVDRLTQYAAEMDYPLPEAAARADRIDGLGAKAVEGLRKLATALEDVGISAANGKVAEMVWRATDHTGYLAMVRADESDEAAGREQRLADLFRMAAEWEKENPDGTAAEWLADVALTAVDQEEAEDADRVSVMTIHAAKGLEFPAVYVIGCEQGTLPHKRAIEAGPDEVEEERRLMFVAITRAERQLWLTWAAMRVVNGGPTFNTPSQFLDELPQGSADVEFSDH